ncbi:LytR/AlgR family response regulator transcription factor [Carboxylicivirga caseinilyticus]|uniref:LytR/AlgR family response regulator transcription factor n=1 Tax=Carboxylicivirga caseinilyticus TaxID=3417572 RepID=UPI003D3520DF|nr:DNA-binding response regulator [Marinilabiliaceae bacterium A049]
MSQIKLLIVEDDLYNQRAVEKTIENHFQEIEIVAKATSVKEGLEAIEQHHPDLLILDIHLTDGTSFDILRQSDYNSYKVVFMSAYHEYALEALKFSSVDFVFKPFDINELIIAIDKAIDEIMDESYDIKIKALFDNIDFQNKNKKVVLQGKHNVKVCQVEEIVWAKAIVGGANFYFEDGSYFFTSKPLRRYESILSTHAFFRCHPHYLINLLKVKEVKYDMKRIHMTNDDEVAFETRRYNQLINALHPNIHN